MEKRVFGNQNGNTAPQQSMSPTLTYDLASPVVDYLPVMNGELVNNTRVPVPDAAAEYQMVQQGRTKQTPRLENSHGDEVDSSTGNDARYNEQKNASVVTLLPPNYDYPPNRSGNDSNTAGGVVPDIYYSGDENIFEVFQPGQNNASTSNRHIPSNDNTLGVQNCHYPEDDHIFGVYQPRQNDVTLFENSVYATEKQVRSSRPPNLQTVGEENDVTLVENTLYAGGESNVERPVKRVQQPPPDVFLIENAFYAC